MRILFVSHRHPFPPTFGSKVRAFNVIRHLAQGHEVCVVSLARSAAEAQAAAGLSEVCPDNHVIKVPNALQAVKIALTLPSMVSASEAFFHSFEMQRTVDRLLASRSFDLAFVHCSAVGRYLEHAQGLPRLIDYCDVDSRKWQDYTAFKPWPLSWGYRWEAIRLAAVERRLARAYDAVTVATAGEMNLLREAGIESNVDWFANGVDAQYFAPDGQAHDPEVITFVGRMDYFPNEQCMEEFCAGAWSLLHQRRPGLKLQIVGAAPTLRVRQLERHPGVIVTGAVPDVRPYVRRSALTIAPLRIARGTQNKILESMAMGVPVVCSPVAALGVDALAGEHLLVADGAGELADTIERVLGDASLRRKLAEAGRQRVVSHHDWPSAMRRMDAIIDRCTSAPAAAPALPDR